MLKGLSLTPVLLTGDAAGTAQGVAGEVGIARVVAEVLPQDKVAEVRRLQPSSWSRLDLSAPSPS